MRIITLNAENWWSPLDFYDALLAALGAPSTYARNVNALLDGMIWDGEHALLKPPYTIRVSGIEKLSNDTREAIDVVKRCVSGARTEFRERRGSDVQVFFEIFP